MVSVNKISSLNFVTRPSFKAESKDNKNIPQEQKCDANGCECLANYNKVLTQKLEPCVLAPLKPEEVSNIDDIEGEKIYTSDGKLHSVVQENDDVKKIYVPDEEDEHTVAVITTIDKKTGKTTREQSIVPEENYVSVREYSPKTGKIVKSTAYEDGKLDYTENTFYKPSGETISETYNANSKTFEISRDNDNHSQHVVYDKNKQLIEARDYKQKKNENIYTTASFYNGGMYKIDKHTEAVLPNNLGRELFINNQELKPAEKFVPPIDVKGYKGEKTYYSNNAIETNTFELDGEKVVAKFNPDGDITEYSTPSKKVTISEYMQEIEENLDGERTKTTQFYGDGLEYVDVTIETKDSYKEISYDAKTKNPTHYAEGLIDENGEHDDKTSLYFNKKGMLKDAFQF